MIGWFKRKQEQPIGMNGRPMVLTVLECGLGRLSDDQHALFNVASIADLMRLYQRGALPKHPGYAGAPRSLGDYADTVLK